MNRKIKEVKKNNNQINAIIAVLGILIFILALIIKEDTIIKLYLTLTSIAVLLIAHIFKRKEKIKYIPFLLVIYILITMAIDSITVIIFTKVPIYSYNIVDSNEVRVYNAIGLRVWQCNKNYDDDLKVDLFYNNGYMCDASDIDNIDSNSFLNSVVENYSEYKNKYVKVTGKINKKNGQNYIEMQPYETNSITVNGYVTFADNITLKIVFKDNTQELDYYDVYDEITVVGIIKNIEAVENRHAVYMYDTLIVSNKNLNEFTITATTEEICDENMLIHTNDKNNLYLSCISEMVVSYPDGSKYEIATALSANKVQVNDLYKNSISSKKSELDATILYEMETYNVIVCDNKKSKDIIIGNKSLSINDSVCKNTIIENE